MSPDQLKAIFTYHAPHGDQAQRYEQLRAGGRVLAELVNNLAPESAEKTLAIRRIQEAVMYANAAIACNGPALTDPKSAVVDICPRCCIAITPLDLVIIGADGVKRHDMSCCPIFPKPGCTNSTGPDSRPRDRTDLPHSGAPL